MTRIRFKGFGFCRLAPFGTPLEQYQCGPGGPDFNTGSLNKIAASLIIYIYEAFASVEIDVRRPDGGRPSRPKA